MNQPQIIEIKNTKGFNLREFSKKLNGLDVVFVGTKSEWENPFKVKYDQTRGYIVITDSFSLKVAEIGCSILKDSYESQDQAIKDSIKCYTKYLFPYEHEKSEMVDFFVSKVNLESVEKVLRGKNLAIRGKLENNFHAKYLLEIAN